MRQALRGRPDYHGFASRSLRLASDVDLGRGEAKYKDGVLDLTIR